MDDMHNRDEFHRHLSGALTALARIAATGKHDPEAVHRLATLLTEALSLTARLDKARRPSESDRSFVQ
jgi:hypothetical protein